MKQRSHLTGMNREDAHSAHDRRHPARSDQSDRTQQRRQHPAGTSGVIGRVYEFITASRAHKRLTVAGVVLIVLIVSVYPPVRDLYVAMRTRDDLNARNAQLEAENSDLRDDIAYLQSTEGIEDEARRLGYVREGETAVVVEEGDGSSTSSGQTHGSSTRTTAVSGSSFSEGNDVTADEPWYQLVLDKVFFYTHEEW